MSRVAHVLSKSTLILAVPLIVLAAGIIGATTSYHASPKAAVTIQHSQTTDVKYKGVNGQTALALLQKYANVQLKHYSFGDMVTSINGTAGTGPKYWSFYVNGKLAEVGAGSYITHDSDSIEWKLQ